MNKKKTFRFELFERFNQSQSETCTLHCLVLWMIESIDIMWNDHVSSICSPTITISLLNAVETVEKSWNLIRRYSISVIRPVTGYACFVWHSLAWRKNKQLSCMEAIQRRAVRLIFANELPTTMQEINNAMSSLTSLADRREQAAFQSIL